MKFSTKIVILCFFTCSLVQHANCLEQGMRRTAHARAAMRGGWMSNRQPPESSAETEIVYPSFQIPYAADPRRTCTGYWSVGCVRSKNSSLKYYYHDYVPELDRQPMTRAVCWDFCAEVAGASYFGLEAGTKCFCTPFLDFEHDKVELAACDTACEGDVGQFCGSRDKATIFQMHDCKNRPPTKCHQKPPPVENAQLFKSPAYYGQMIVCSNLLQKEGDHIAHRRCEVECKFGYEETFNNIECTEMGDRDTFTWGEFQGRATCVPVSCGYPKFIENTKYSPGEVFFPDQVRYTCHLGYSLTGDVSDPKAFDVNCTGHGYLTGYQKCEPIECGRAPSDANAILNQARTYTFGEKVSYTCIYGYTLNEDAYGDTIYSRECEADGNFSDGEECLGVRCGPIPHYEYAVLATHLPPHEKFFRYPMSLSYQCLDGFSLDAKPALSDTSNTVFGTTCSAEGEMSLTISPCKRVSCKFPPPALQSTWFPSTARVYEDQVTYHCEEGYTLDQEADGPASFFITCGAGGDFTPFEGTCLPVKCGEPKSSLNSKVVKHCMESKMCTFQMVADYTCDPGYSTRVDDDPAAPAFATFSSKCQANGNFTEIPACVNIDNCKGKTCGGHGTCVDHENPTGDAASDWHCACDPGYESDQISTGNGDKICSNINDCPTNASFAYQCSGAGTCVDLVLAYTCNCSDGYQLISLKDSDNSTCIPLGCGLVPTVSNSSHENVSWPRATELFDNTKLIASKAEMFYTQPAVGYTCDSGFSLNGLASGTKTFEVSCLLNGSDVVMSNWPTCKPVSCGAPPAIDHADPARLMDVMRYNEDVAKRTLPYTCQEGYTTDAGFHRFIPNASFEVTCNADGNQTGAQSCVPVKCPKPPEVDNAVAAVPDERVTFPESMEYTCDVGHSTDGSNNAMTKTFSVTCQYNSQLTETKECVPIVCGELATPDFGWTEASLSSMIFNKTATFKANDGHSLTGRHDGPKEYTVACLANSSFSASPKLIPFKPVECGLPPAVKNAQHTPEAKVFSEKVNYTCNPGYTTDGQPAASTNVVFEIECQADGNFTATKMCKPVLCAILPSPSNATLSPAKQAPLTYTKSARFECKPGYTLPDGETDFLVPCQQDGTFATSPDCSNINDCEAPDVLCGQEGHGHCVDKDPPTGIHIDDYDCACDAGFNSSMKYDVSGAPQRYCENIDDCPADGCNPGGCEDLILDYLCHCPVGYFFYNGTSKGEEHACKKQACGTPPNVTHASVNASGVQYYKDVVEYTCGTGYTLTGEVDEDTTFTVTCKAKAGGSSEGSFSAVNHTCKPVSCGIPDSLPHSRRSRDHEMTFEQELTYTCKTGYSTDRECHETDVVFDKVCSSDGAFKYVSEEGATCMSVKAGVPSIQHASHKKGPMYFPDERAVVCDEGYSLDGTNAKNNNFALRATSKCTIELVPEESSCKIMTCGAASPKANSNYDTGDKVLEYTEVVTYTGLKGYTLNGRHDGPKTYKMECLANGSLESITQAGELPFEPVQCGAPPYVAQASYSTADRHYEQTVDYTCNAGYSTDAKPASEGGITNFTIVCEHTGDFTAVKECKRIVCGTGPDVPKASRVSTGDIVYEGKASYECLPGYSLDGNLDGVTEFNLTCLETGDFVDPPQCQDMIDCKGSMCGVGGTCKETLPPTGVHWDDHYCDCKSGYEPNVTTKNGKKYKTCGNTPDCPPLACEPGFCTDLVNDYKCNCPAGYHEGPNKAEKLKHDCLADPCGKPPQYEHSSIKSSKTAPVFGDTVKYTCETGYTVDGSPNGAGEFTVECALSDSPDKSVDFTKGPGCNPVKCPVTPSLSLSNSTTKGPLTFGQTVTYKCDKGYSHLQKAKPSTCPGESEYTLVCSANGSYVNDDGSEVAKLCSALSAGVPQPGSLPNALYETYEMFYPDSQAVQCKAGYSTDPTDPGANTFTLQVADNCSFNSHPTCVAVSCGKAPKVNFATSDKEEQDILFPTKVSYTTGTCYTVDGTVNGPRTFSTECKADGNFKSLLSYLPLLPVVCVPKDRPGTITPSDETICDEKVIYKCKKGFSTDGTFVSAEKGNGQFEETCTPSGNFTKTGTCVPVKCPTVPEPEHAISVASGAPKYYNDTISFECKPGFSLDGTMSSANKFTLRCLASGSFSEAPGNCTNIDNCAEGGDSTCAPHGTCEDLPVPTGVHYNDYTCKCDSGFKLLKANGTGSSCGNVEDCPTDACQAKYPDGAIIQGVCQDLVNDYSCSCAFGSYAVSDKHDCEVQSCGAYPVLQYASKPPYTAGSKSSKSKSKSKTAPTAEQLYNRSYTYTCEDGYTLDGSAGSYASFTVKCGGVPGNGSDGNRTGIETCKPVSCNVPQIAHAKVNATKFLFSEVLTYSCDLGYSTKGSCDSPTEFKMTCEADGLAKFVDEAYTGCVSNVAGIPNVSNSNLSSAIMRYPDSQIITCADGYSTNSSDVTAKTFTVYTTPSCGFKPHPDCVLVGCDPVPQVPHANSSGGTKFGDKRTYRCNAGYTLDGKVTKKAVLPKCECHSPNGHEDAYRNGATPATDSTLCMQTLDQGPCYKYTGQCNPDYTPCQVAPVYEHLQKETFDGDRCIDDGKNYHLPTGPYTIEVEVKPASDVGSGGIIGWGEYGDSNEVNALRFNNGPQSIRHYWWSNDLDKYLPYTLADGNFHHLAVTFDGQTRRMYLDYEEIGSKNRRAYYGATRTDTFCLGKTYGNEYFKGELQNVKIWDHARIPKAETSSSALEGFELLYSTGSFGEDHTSKEDFNKIFQQAGSGIVKRECTDCIATHKEIYYRRKKSPSTYDAYEGLLITWMGTVNFHEDFDLYSSLEDALADKNAWKYCNGNDKNIGFPRDCDPTEHRIFQWTSLTHHRSRKNIKYSVLKTQANNVPRKDTFTISCQASGKFEDPKQCLPVQCGKVPEVDFGTCTGSKEMLVFKDQATCTCDTGYTLAPNGAASGLKTFNTTCNMDGVYDGLQTCTPVVCDSPLMHKGNSHKTYQIPLLSPQLIYGSMVVYSCNGGYSITGKPSVIYEELRYMETCQANGTITNEGKCVNIDYCLTGKDYCGPGGECVDGFLNYTCNCSAGYEAKVTAVAGDGTRERCVEINECKADKGDKFCQPGTCKDGLDKYTCECDKGYHAEQRRNSSKAQVCTANQCPNTPAVPNAHASLPAGKTLAYPTKVFYTCNLGYSVDGKPSGETEFTMGCQADTTFKRVDNLGNISGDGALLTCKPVACPPLPDVLNTRRYYENPDGSEFTISGSTLTLNKGWNEGGEYTITNKSDGKGFKVTGGYGGGSGTYDHEEGTINFKNGINSETKEDFMNTKPFSPKPMFYKSPPANYTCMEGFTTNADAGGPTKFSVECLSSGKLTEPEKCLPVECGTYPQIAKVASVTPATPADMVYQDVKNYSCQEGHTITGFANGSENFSVKCNKTGGIIGAEICMPVSCGVPPVFENSKASTSEKVYGVPHKVKCIEGYKTDQGKSSFTLFCLANGSYSYHTGCQPVSCGVPQPTGNATPQVIAPVYFPQNVTYVCNDEFSLNGAEDGQTNFTRICSAGGEFEGPKGCKDINYCIGHPCGRGDCFDVTLSPEKVPNTANFLQTTAGKPVASNGNYVCYCDDGYETTTVDGKLTCTEDDCHGSPCGKGKGICTDLSTAPNASEDAYSCTCFTGYELSTTENGTTTCVPVVCEPSPPLIAHTMPPKHKRSNFKRLTSNPNAVLYQDVIGYKCIPGFSTDGGTSNVQFKVQCSESGILEELLTGNPSLPSCVPVICGAPQAVPLASFPPGVDAPAIMSTVSPAFTYTCAKGHQLADGSTNFSVVCQNNGELSPTQICSPRVCGELADVAHSTMSVAPGTEITYPEYVKFECIYGYKTPTNKSSFRVRCLETGDFSDYESCHPIQCDDGLVFGQPKRVQCPLGTTRDGTIEGLKYYDLECLATGEVVGYRKCLPVKIYLGGIVTDAADPEDKGLPGAEVTLGSTEYFPPTALTYIMTDTGEHCYMESQIRSSSSCKAAAGQLSLTYGGDLETPSRHRYCFLSDGKVYFNGNAMNNMPEPDAQSVCYKGPGMFTKFRILPSADTGEMGGPWKMSSFDAYYTNDCSGERVPIESVFASGGSSNATQAFDGNLDSAWMASSSHLYEDQEWVGFETALPTVVRCIKVFQCAANSGGCAPNLKVQGKEMGTSKWINLVLSAETEGPGNWTKMEMIPAVLKQDLTTADGKYSVQVSIGNFTISGSKHGYITILKDVHINSVNANGPRFINLPLSEVLQPNEWRLVMMWHNVSRDLDMWTYFGPATQCRHEDEETMSLQPWYSCNGCLVFYGQMESECYDSPLSAVLENDDVDGVGPETLRFKGMGECHGPECKIIFAVDNYPEVEDPLWAPLGDSGGEVTIYSGHRERGRVKVPATAGGAKWIPLLVIDAETLEYRMWKESDWGMGLYGY